jgi:hypothetical protein
MGLIPDTKLGPYEIASTLGVGGMSEVYRARDTRLGRDVAIKVLPESLADDADRLLRFEQEARTIAALNHPNILGIFDVGVHGTTRYLVSELLEGETLRQKLEAGPLSARRATEYAAEIAHGLPLILLPHRWLSDIPPLPYTTSIAAEVMVFTWIFRNTGGSVLMPVPFHGMSNVAMILCRARRGQSSLTLWCARGQSRHSARFHFRP